MEWTFICSASWTWKKTGLRESQASFRFWNWPRRFPRSLEVGVDHLFGVPQRFDSRFAIRDDAGQFRHFGEKTAILFTPVNYDFVFVVYNKLFF
jgi:hypothetical protein